MSSTHLSGLATIALLSLAVTPATHAQQPQSTQSPDSVKPAIAPFSTADWTWLNGNSRQKESVLDGKYFTGEFRADISYIGDFNHPKDHTLAGTSESGRTSEVQVQQLGIGGDFHAGNARGRVMTQFGMYSTMTPRNDASPARGQWQMADAYRYLSEAYGGYHFDKMHGINVDAGIFMSYVGLFSYYNFDNWAYQPSYVSSNTPWFFNGIRLQFFPTENLKIEPWIVNGWQSYGMFNEQPGLGAQVLYRPMSRVSVLSNNYYGADWLGIPDRKRMHSDNSIEVKYLDDPRSLWSKGALSLTVDGGCEWGGGVSCTGGSDPQQSFAGFMLYNRAWFNEDKFAVTVGGGAMNNPGRYLVLVPPINGATAVSGTPYFTANPGDPFHAWDASITFDMMPDQFTTFRMELNHRESSVPYFAGPGGITPAGGNTGSPASVVAGFTPDLRKTETRINVALLVKL
ncbi:MAG: outer membrane beta-barrel protein [bacterium]